jgi:ABC-type nitrate/sulfonate/bicarbonate transport system permease component
VANTGSSACADDDNLNSPLRHARHAPAVDGGVAQSGFFARALMPTLPTIAQTFAGMIADGSMFGHVAATLARVLIGFGVAVAVGLPLGTLISGKR